MCCLLMRMDFSIDDVKNIVGIEVYFLRVCRGSENSWVLVFYGWEVECGRYGLDWEGYVACGVNLNLN